MSYPPRRTESVDEAGWLLRNLTNCLLIDRRLRIEQQRYQVFDLLLF